jgi:hypothetical protein
MEWGFFLLSTGAGGTTLVGTRVVGNEELLRGHKLKEEARDEGT